MYRTRRDLEHLHKKCHSFSWRYMIYSGKNCTESQTIGHNTAIFSLFVCKKTITVNVCLDKNVLNDHSVWTHFPSKLMGDHMVPTKSSLFVV